MNETNIPRIVIAGTNSGVGKTSIVVGLIEALKERGLKVACFKCGPDYLDPTYHKEASGRGAANLDSWLMNKDILIESFIQESKGADIAIIEGVMGLFDGSDIASESGSTAQIAKWLDAPVLLVIDASGMARTIAAIAKGFKEFDPELNMAGIICNRVGSKSHLELLKKAVNDPPIIGGVKKCKEKFAERHLGLVTASNKNFNKESFLELKNSILDLMEIDNLLEISKKVPIIKSIVSNDVIVSKKCKIAVAYDEAFHFYYKFNLSLLEKNGAEIVYFSPIHDKLLPEVDGVYIGGGYPEVYARELEANVSMKDSINKFATDGGVIYGECGGLIYLSKDIIQLDGLVSNMVGVLPGSARMNGKLSALGYNFVEIKFDTILGKKGTIIKGHQFRYSEMTFEIEPSCKYKLIRKRDRKEFNEGYSYKNVLGSYVHAHWGDTPEVAKYFIDFCHNNKEIV